jgi:hypothetical protein
VKTSEVGEAEEKTGSWRDEVDALNDERDRLAMRLSRG